MNKPKWFPRIRNFLNRLRLLIKFMRAKYRYSKEFHKQVPKIVFLHRLETCIGCEHLDRKHFMCMLCECDVRLKAEWEEEGCPDTPPRWSEFKAIENKEK